MHGLALGAVWDRIVVAAPCWSRLAHCSNELRMRAPEGVAERFRQRSTAAQCEGVAQGCQTGGRKLSCRAAELRRGAQLCGRRAGVERCWVISGCRGSKDVLAVLRGLAPCHRRCERRCEVCRQTLEAAPRPMVLYQGKRRAVEDVSARLRRARNYRRRKGFGKGG